MLNKEKFKDEIFEIACSCNRVSVRKDTGTPVQCSGTSCSNCIAGSIDKSCSVTISNWMNSEYEEHVDWSKIPVDTKILVRDIRFESWIPRHFAKYEDGVVYAFNDGKTSFTNGNNNTLPWNYTKLYKGDEES